MKAAIMRKTTILLLLLLVVINAFSQSPANPKHFSDYYLRKSKIQKIEAWALSGGGAASVITSILIPRGEKLQMGLCIFDCAKYKNDNTKFGFLSVGVTAMLTSVPFFILSAKNKRKAAGTASIHLNNQRISVLQQNSFFFRTQPALSLRIEL